MSLLRLKDNTPYIYQEQSRDFQLISRLYDCIINGVIHDSESITDITSTHDCLSNVLPLLQTKLGFFTNASITDEDLRYVLKAFPTIIKNKGSLKAVEQAVITFLKLSGLNTSAVISYTNKDDDGNAVYQIKIGIKSSFKETVVLDEVLKYVLPTGYTISYYFYTNESSAYSYIFNDSSKSVVVSTDVGAILRGSNDDRTTSYKDPVSKEEFKDVKVFATDIDKDDIGAVGTTLIVGSTDVGDDATVGMRIDYKKTEDDEEEVVNAKKTKK